MVINAAAAPDGSVKVELLDGNCRSGAKLRVVLVSPDLGDELRHTVRWEGQDPGLLPGRPVRIRFALEDARLLGYCTRWPGVIAAADTVIRRERAP